MFRNILFLVIWLLFWSLYNLTAPFRRWIDKRFEEKQLLILGILSQNRGWMYGLDLVNHSEGSLRRGTIYIILADMIEKGWIKSSREKKEDFPKGRKMVLRTLYCCTPKGIDHLIDINISKIKQPAV